MTEIPVITAAERQALHAFASVLNAYVDEGTIAARSTGRTAHGRLLPGEDYNERGEVLAELQAGGYQVIGQKGEVTLLKRPGKTEPGISATFGYGGCRCFYSFSTNDPTFEPRKPYSAFAVYTFLRHGKDRYKEAAASLAAEGYGDPLTAKAATSSVASSGTEKPASAAQAVMQSPPEPMHEAAYYGLTGEIVRTIEPHSESDPVAILVQFLLHFGSVIGRNSFFEASSSQHFTNLFAVMVGDSSKGRKGSGLSAVRYVFDCVAREWCSSRIMAGLSSGEGLLHAVRDPVEAEEPIKEKGRVVGSQTVIKDKGEADKRLLITETEFGRTLRVMQREANTLSAIIRQAWDTGNIQVLTKNPTYATNAHISIIGHITRDELKGLVSESDLFNGFANRFLWIYQRRSKLLPEGGNLSLTAFDPLCIRLQDAIEFGGKTRCLQRDKEATALWAEVYPKLEEEVPGLLGAVTARSSPIVLRLAMLYALLDLSEWVRVPHLQAALAVWEYAEDSAKYIFGDAVGDSVADVILTKLRQTPGGLDMTGVSALFNRNTSSARLRMALALLTERGYVEVETEATGGRPREIWKALK